MRDNTGNWLVLVEPKEFTPEASSRHDGGCQLVADPTGDDLLTEIPDLGLILKCCGYVCPQVSR
jgi:hypothetical protein